MLGLDRRLSVSIFNGSLNYPKICRRRVLGFHELLHCWGNGVVYGKGRNQLRHSTALPYSYYTWGPR